MALFDTIKNGLRLYCSCPTVCFFGIFTQYTSPRCGFATLATTGVVASTGAVGADASGEVGGGVVEGGGGVGALALGLDIVGGLGLCVI